MMLFDLIRTNLLFVGFVLVTVPMCDTNGSRILSVTFFASKSFRNAFDPCFFELANRGHELTIISPIAPPKNHPNIREINLVQEQSPLDNSKFSKFFKQRQDKEVTNILLAGEQAVAACHQFLKMPQVLDLIKEVKFDVILGVGIGNECSYGYIHQFNTSFILLSPITATFYLSAISGSPIPPSFVPTIFAGFSDQMNFVERTQNFLTRLWYYFYYKFHYTPLMDSVNREYFGQDTPSIDEIAKNVSLVLTSSHFSVNYPRPFMPDQIDIGGLYCQTAKPLPADLEEFVSNSKGGFIYLSMGSVLQGSSMPDHFRQSFVSVFRKLGEKGIRILWKWETETMEDQPENVKLIKWAPQQDILGHSKILMFITHAGGLSSSEAAFNGVPILGIPFFGDQDYNIKVAEKKNYGLKLELGDLTEDTLMDSINKILYDPKYAKTAKFLSTIFRDRPKDPLETGIYWIEYVIRHSGATHLRSAARDLTFIQYYSVDVLLTLLIALSLFLFFIYSLIKLFARKFICSRNEKLTKAKKSQ